MKTKHIVIALGLLGLITTTNCSSRFGKTCENERNCGGGNDADQDACIERLRAAENVADAYDCGNQFDTYADCIENAPCKNKNIDSTVCAAQSKSLSDCRNAASGRKD